MHVIILGAPGSGKGTQSIKITDQFSLKHLSTGELLRAEIATGSELGKAAKIIIDNGELVNDEIILDMVAQQIKKTDKGILFDGFPRTVIQAKELDNLLKKLNSKISHVIQLDIDNKEIIKRMLDRGRADDNEKTILNRIYVFEKQTKPLVEYYRKQNKLSTILGTGTITEIFARIEKVLKIAG